MAGKIIDEDVLKLTVQNLTQLIADHVYEEIPYQDSEIDNMFDGTAEDIDYYSSLISDTLVSENRIFSSKHVTDLLQQFQLDANAYADEIATRTLTTEIVTATSEVIKENVLYLILSDSVTNTYEQYMLIGGNATPLGSTKIDLSDVYTKSEMDTKLSDKANKSEVLKISDVITDKSLATNSNVLTAKTVVDELDLKANDSEVVKKTDIVTTIDSTSTDDTIPSTKAVFTPINNIQESLTSLTSIADLNNFKGKSFMIGRGTEYNNTTANFPNGVSGAFVVEYLPYYDGENYGVQRLTMVQPINGKYVTFERSLDNGNWMGWQRLCSTSVADTSGTVTLPDGVVGTISYKVINGICYVSVQRLADGLTGGQVPTFTGLPKAGIYVNTDIESSGYRVGSIYSDDGVVFHVHKTSTDGGYSSFSYPVKES